ITFFGGQFSADNPCQQNFGSIMFKTRSSASFTASLKDFAGPFPFIHLKTVSVAAPPLTTLSCSNPSATICAHVTANSPPVTIWQGPAATCSATHEAPIVSHDTCLTVSIGGNGSGYYLFSAIVSAGFSADTCFFVPVDVTPPPLSGGGTNVSCNGLSNVWACVTASGGSAPYSYAWSTGATTGTGATTNCI